MSSLWDSLSLDLGTISNAFYNQPDLHSSDGESAKAEESQVAAEAEAPPHPLSRFVASPWLSDCGDCVVGGALVNLMTGCGRDQIGSMLPARPQGPTGRPQVANT